MSFIESCDSGKGPATPRHDLALWPCSQAGKSIPKKQKLAATAKPTKRSASGARSAGRRRKAEPAPDATQVRHHSSVTVLRGLHARFVLLHPCTHAVVPAAGRLMHRRASLLDVYFVRSTHAACDCITESLLCA